MGKDRQKRREGRWMAISFILSHLDYPDEVSSLEVWNKGHELLDRRVPFPAQSKMSFKGFKNKEALGNTMRSHPALIKSHRVTSHKAAGRTTIYLVVKE